MSEMCHGQTFATHGLSAPLFQLNAHTFTSVQQPSQVKASKGIAGMRPDQRRKGWHRPGTHATAATAIAMWNPENS
jgi:hypothetical protein